MKTFAVLVCAFAFLSSLVTAAPAMGHELQQVLQDVGEAAASPFGAWRYDDEVDVEKHKKKKTKTKTKYKTKTKASVSTTTTTTTATPSTSHHHHSATSTTTKKHKHSPTKTITPTATSTSTKPGLPPIVPPPPTDSSSDRHSHSYTPSTSSTITATSTAIESPTTSHTHGAIPTSGPIDSGLVRHVLKEAKVIPTVINDFHPSFLINTTFPHSHSPFLGRSLALESVQEAPRVTLYPPESRSNDSRDATLDVPMNNLVITLTDPDAPSHKDPKWSEICHWIAVGVPVRADDVRLDLVSASTFQVLHEVMPFKPPGPPPETGPHRYVLLAFTPENATTEPLDLVQPGDRQHWGYKDAGRGVKDWAMEMGLLPLAGDFFTAEHSS